MIEHTTDSYEYEPFAWKLYVRPFRFADWHLRYRCGRFAYDEARL